MPSSESPSRLRQRLTWIIAAVVLLGAVVAWRMSGRDAPAAQFQTAAVDRGDIVSRVSASGTLSATTPPPACTYMVPSFTSAVRSTMQVSIEPSAAK